MGRPSITSRIRLSASVLLVVAAVLGCGDASQLSGNITIDVGRVEQGTLIERKVHIHDAGSRLRVSEVESDCACTAALLAGESGDEPGSILVAIDTTSFRGPFRRHVRVKSDSVESGSRTITFVGFAYSVGPALSVSEVSFGGVDNRLSHTMEVDLLNPESEANGDWRVTAVVDDTPGVHAEYYAGKGLECTVEQGMPIGRHHGRITVEYQLNGSDDLADVRTLIMPFSLKAYQAVRIRPDVCFLGASAVGSSSELAFELVGDMAVVPAQFTDEWGNAWHVEASREAGYARLVGQFQTPSSPGPFAGTLSFVSSGHSELPLTVAYSGVATERD